MTIGGTQASSATTAAILAPEIATTAAAERVA